MSDTPTLALVSATIDMNYLRPAFEAACPGIELRIWPDLGDGNDIDAVVCWEPPPGVIATLPKLKLIQSLAAGIDHLVRDPALPDHIPLCRIVDSQMASGMAAYVAWAVVHGQRHMGAYLAQQRAGEWREQPVQHPPQHRVGIAGFGALGQACARTLLSIGYAVRGWKRSASEVPADLAAVSLFHGDDQLADFLSGCDTLVCLLPLTEATRNRIDARFLAALPKGAHLVNVGRGDHVVDADLLMALASGQLGAATLDAFRTEPLPAGHPFWRHPRITVTPHIATRTPASVIARQTLANLSAILSGRATEVAIDRHRGY
ncbi:glyoxylate/hydroxypyruvate reductase A [Ideonella sp. DXS22W]|uniref:Glyoxylate/hydroxypyruvate reductase A n=1 Tax=Pseudaquabacterium inlustre TaxID=2984192 RepID=A0ABU9CGF3_9BURK